MKKGIYGLFGMAMLLLAGCVHDDYTANTLNPETGLVKVTLTRPMGKSSALMVDMNRVELDENSCLPPLAPNVTHDILCYTSDEEVAFKAIAVEGGEILVWLPTSIYSFMGVEYTTASSDFLPLYSCSRQLRVAADSYTEITLDQKPLSGTIDLTLTIANGVPANIAKMESVVTGFLSNVNLTTGEAFATKADVALVPEFTISGDVMSAQIDAIEVDPHVSQSLYLYFEMEDGTEQYTMIDLSTQLEGFNASRGKVLQISGSFSLPTVPSLEGVLVDWERVEVGDLTVE